MKDLKPTQLLRLLAVAVLLSFLAACSDDDDVQDGTVSKIFSYSVMNNCADCHISPSFSKSSFKSDVVNKTNTGNWKMEAGFEQAAGAVNCGSSYPLVTPGMPIQSSLLMTISSKYANTGCTSAYGYHSMMNAEASSGLTEDLIKWIENGAK